MFGLVLGWPLTCPHYVIGLVFELNVSTSEGESLSTAAVAQYKPSTLTGITKFPVKWHMIGKRYTECPILAHEFGLGIGKNKFCSIWSDRWLLLPPLRTTSHCQIRPLELDDSYDKHSRQSVSVYCIFRLFQSIEVAEA